MKMPVHISVDSNSLLVSILTLANKSLKIFDVQTGP